MPVTINRILVVGGTGRVGARVALHIRQSHPTHNIIICGRNKTNGQKTVDSLNNVSGSGTIEFQSVDLDQPSTIQSVLHDNDTVVNCAGPYQLAEPVLLRECVKHGNIDYIDICDDIYHAKNAIKQYHTQAQQNNVRAIICCGPFPGLDNIIASKLRDDCKAAGSDSDTCQLRFFVAGTGGAGSTVVTTTYMLSMVPMTAYVDNNEKKMMAMTKREYVDFGGCVGVRPVYHFELPEVVSLHDTIGFKTIDSKFGIAPDCWNWLTWFYAQFLWWAMTNKARVQKIVDWSWDSILYIDTIVGHSIGIQVRVKQNNNDKKTGKPVWRIVNYNSPDTMTTIALGVRVFVTELINNKSIRSGVYFPEQAINTVQHRQTFLTSVSKELNKIGEYSEKIINYDPTFNGTYYDTAVGIIVSFASITPGLKSIINHMKQNKSKQFQFLQRHL